MRTRQRINPTPVPDSVGFFISWLLQWKDEKSLPPCPEWPPDLFAVVALVLYQNGEYRRVVQPIRHSAPRIGGRQDWLTARRAGRTWRQSLEKIIESQQATKSLSKARPSSVQTWWRIVTAHWDWPISKLGHSRLAIKALFDLFFAADEACAGFGMVDGVARGSQFPDEPGFPARPAPFLQGQAQRLLKELNSSKSLCVAVRPELVSVLPKLHTSQVGLTLRSLSQNLALCRASGIDSYWNGAFVTKRETKQTLNLLLLPWPDKFDINDFKLVENHRAESAELPHNAGYFDYAPKRPSPKAFITRLRKALKKAKKISGEIHAVVFPELALDLPLFAAAERVAWQHGVMLIGGVQISDKERHLNLCAIQPLGLLETPGSKKAEGLGKRLHDHRIFQSKHHRWCLDRNQILQYRLGGRLDAGKRWWEYMEVPPRRVNFVSIENWLTWCVLICEDLARQDPVAQVIRAVGPNLVIALLMDGPQLQKRWPARYASVLADDPGSSVLTLSSLAMVRRSQPSDAAQPRDVEVEDSVIALWSDRIRGSKEISLKPGEDACVLNLVCHSEHEFTADGHSDHEGGHFVVYAGHHTFGP